MKPLPDQDARVTFLESLGEPEPPYSDSPPHDYDPEAIRAIERRRGLWWLRESKRYVQQLPTDQGCLTD